MEAKTNGVVEDPFTEGGPPPVTEEKKPEPAKKEAPVKASDKPPEDAAAKPAKKAAAAKEEATTATTPEKKDYPKTIHWKDPKYEIVIVPEPGNDYQASRIKLPLDDTTTRTMKDPKVGVLEPIIVEDAGEKKGKTQLVVIDGIQRTKHWNKACTELEKEKSKAFPPMPIRVRTVKDAEQRGAMSTVANVHRTDDPPLVTARHAKAMIDAAPKDAKGNTDTGHLERIRVYFRYKSVGAMLDGQKVLGLAKPVQDMVEERQLSVTAGAVIATLPKEEQAQAAAEVITKGLSSVRGVRKIVYDQKAATKSAKKDAAAKNGEKPKKSAARKKKSAQPSGNEPGRMDVKRALRGFTAKLDRLKSAESLAKAHGVLEAFEWFLTGKDEHDEFKKAVDEGKDLKDQEAPV